MLQLLAISGIFVGIGALGTTMLNVQHRSRWNTVIQTLTAAVTLVLAYALMPWGLTGVGVAFLVGSIVGAAGHLMAQVSYFRSVRAAGPASADPASAGLASGGPASAARATAVAQTESTSA
jgi:O-antigen/teichoic acid export membrane protein